MLNRTSSNQVQQDLYKYHSYMIKTENLKFQYKKEGATFSFPDINLDTQENLLIFLKFLAINHLFEFPLLLVLLPILEHFFAVLLLKIYKNTLVNN